MNDELGSRDRDHDEDSSDLQPQPASEASSAGRAPRRSHGGRARAAALALLFVTTAVLCTLLVAVSLVFFKGKAELAKLVPGLGSPQPTASVSTEAVILRSLEDASELTTAVYNMETIVTERLDRKLGPWTVGDTKLLYVAYARVRAGVDLSALSPSDVSVDGGAVTIKLGPPQLLGAEIDVNRSYVYDVDRSLFGPVDPDLQSRAERYALRQAVDAATDAGLLDEARSRAELVVRSLIEPVVDGPVVVEIAPALPDD